MYIYIIYNYELYEFILWDNSIFLDLPFGICLFKGSFFLGSMGTGIFTYIDPVKKLNKNHGSVNIFPYGNAVSTISTLIMANHGMWWLPWGKLIPFDVSQARLSLGPSLGRKKDAEKEPNGSYFFLEDWSHKMEGQPPHKIEVKWVTWCNYTHMQLVRLSRVLLGGWTGNDVITAEIPCCRAGIGFIVFELHLASEDASQIELNSCVLRILY